MRPRVILFNAVSVDGRMDRLDVDLGLFYSLAARFGEDATLVGSETILKAPGQGPADPPDASRPAPDPSDGRGLLVCPDSRGRVRNWGWVLSWPFWRDVLVLTSPATPKDYLAYLDRMSIRHLETGSTRVDLGAALERLAEEHGIKVLRVDGGGRLNGALLRAGLVDEVSVLITPQMIGGTSPSAVFIAPDLTSLADVVRLELTGMEKLEGGLVWLRYEVSGKPETRS